MFDRKARRRAFAQAIKDATGGKNTGDKVDAAVSGDSADDEAVA